MVEYVCRQHGWYEGYECPICIVNKRKGMRKRSRTEFRCVDCKSTLFFSTVYKDYVCWYCNKIYKSEELKKE